MVVQGEDGWLFMGGELRHLGSGKFWGEDAKAVSKAGKPELADPIPAIVDFNNQLKAEGIQLIVLPVPPKAVVYPDKLVPEMAVDAKVDVFLQGFYAELRKQGVDLLDLTERFREERAKGGDPLYCKQDTHWSGRACEIAAKEVLGRVGNPDWLKNSMAKQYKSDIQATEISGDLWVALNDGSVEKETVNLRHISGPDGGLIEPMRESAVLLMGDSHCLVFHAGEDMHARGAGLADQLAVELGFPVDLIGTRGSGSTAVRVDLFRRWRKSPDYYEGKKVIVWCFTARDFSESINGWKTVPIRK